VVVRVVGHVWVGHPECSARTYEGSVKPFGSSVKKEVRMEVEGWEKMWNM